MKTHALRVLLLLPTITALLSSASGALPSSDPPRDGSDIQKEMAPIVAAYKDFSTRLESAVESRELASVAALYQTNGPTAVELKSELARWRQLIAKGAKARSPYFKSLSHLPPESHQYWEAKAHRWTRHPVTDFAILHFQDGSQMTLPLFLVGSTLLIVPSEKINKGIEQNAPPNAAPPHR
jgi:hypothetical protein